MCVFFIEEVYIAYLQAQVEDPNCLIDLIFVVDTSQSVEKAFKKQLQFATALVSVLICLQHFVVTSDHL